MKTRMRNKVELFLILLLFLIALFLRLYKLSDIPNGLYQDETALGYNAYSILETGKDEHGLYMPLYFKSFGDQKLPMYVYLTSLSIKIFGLNAFAVRLPSAILGSLTILLFYVLIKILTENKKLAILSLFMLMINPWHLHFSRAGFEVNVALFFLTLGVVLFLYSVQNTKRLLLLFFSITAFAFSLYSYNLTRLLSPLMLFTLVILYFNHIKKYSLKSMVILIIFAALLLSPFIITFFSPSGVQSARGALITSTDIAAKAVEMRSYLVTTPLLFSKVFFNRWVFIIWQYIGNVVNFFSPSFFFTNGADHGNQGIGNVGMFYVFELPLMLYGFYKIMKNKSSLVLILWFLVTILVASLSKETPHATRGYILVVPMTFFSSYGLYLILLRVFAYKNFAKRVILGSLLVLSLSYSLIFYFSSYYFRFPILYAKEWRYDDKEVAMYLKHHQDEFDKIIIDSESGFIYTSLLFHVQYSPSQFISTVDRYPDDNEGFSKVKSFGKYEFREINWEDDYVKPNAIIITTESRKPDDIPADMHFSLPERPVVLSLKEEIYQYPVSVVSYVSVKTISE